MTKATISYRLANESDLDHLLAQQTNRESDYPGPDLIERWVQSGEFWVAVCDQEIVGWVSLQYTFFEEGFVSTLWVDEALRRRGVASGLLQKARDICKTDRLWTSTNESNHPMQRLMENLGWKPSGTIRHLDPDDPELIYCHWDRS